MKRRWISLMAACCGVIMICVLFVCSEKKVEGAGEAKSPVTNPASTPTVAETKPAAPETKPTAPAEPAVTPAPSPAPASETVKPVETTSGSVEAKGREVAAQFSKCVVTVQMVVKIKSSGPGMGSEEQESRTEADGVIVDPSGLTVLALSATDPMGSMEDMMPEASGGFKMQSNLSDIKILLTDDTEIPAQIVMRDKDLDLAFIRPTEKPAQTLPFVDLSKAAEVQELDQLVAIGRLGQVANRTHSITLERVKAIVKRPRLFYVPESAPALGCSVFSLDGKVVGILVLRTFRADGSGFGGMMGGMEDNILPVIIPASDISEVAKQALTAKPEVVAPETPASPQGATAPGQGGAAGTAETKPANSSSVVIPK